MPKRWYLADLKVHPDYRRRHLPIAMLRRAFFSNWLKCGRGYAIAMNPSDGRVPAGVRLLDHFKWIPPSLFRSEQLDIWSGDVDAAARAVSVFGDLGDSAHFVSLAGIKDLVLESTQQPLALLHLRIAPDAVRACGPQPGPQPGHVHMWCAPRASEFSACCS